MPDNRVLSAGGSLISRQGVAANVGAFYSFPQIVSWVVSGAALAE